MVVGRNALPRCVPGRMYASLRQGSVYENFRIVRGIGPRYDSVVAFGQVKLCAFEKSQVGFAYGFRQDVLSACAIENIKRHATDHFPKHRRIVRIAPVAERKIRVHLRRTAAHVFLNTTRRYGCNAQKSTEYFQ